MKHVFSLFFAEWKWRMLTPTIRSVLINNNSPEVWVGVAAAVLGVPVDHAVLAAPAGGVGVPAGLAVLIGPGVARSDITIPTR